jgi:hypothetical protein
MWNENRSNQTVVDRAIGQGVWQESPLVGVDGLLKKHQASASKAFRLVERPFLELVNLRGDLRDAAFVAAVESVIGCKPPEKPNTTATGNGYDLMWLGPGRVAGALGRCAFRDTGCADGSQIARGVQGIIRSRGRYRQRLHRARNQRHAYA